MNQYLEIVLVPYLRLHVVTRYRYRTIPATLVCEKNIKLSQSKPNYGLRENWYSYRHRTPSMKKYPQGL